MTAYYTCVRACVFSRTAVFVCTHIHTYIISVYTPGYDAELEWLSIIVLTPWTPAPPCCQFEMSMVAGVVLAKNQKKFKSLNLC